MSKDLNVALALVVLVLLGIVGFMARGLKLEGRKIEERYYELPSLSSEKEIWECSR